MRSSLRGGCLRLQIPTESEILRRRRISEANKGKTPWNLGRKHSEGALIAACALCP